MNGFSATCKQTNGFAPDYITAEQTTPNRNRYRLNRVLMLLNFYFLQHYTKALGARAVAYLNIDIAVQGN